MTFERKSGLTTEIFTRQDIVNILRALEPSNPRASFERGWLEALCRVGLACGIRYDAPVPPPSPRMIDEPARMQTPRNDFEALMMGLDQDGLTIAREAERALRDAGNPRDAKTRSAILAPFARRAGIPWDGES